MNGQNPPLYLHVTSTTKRGLEQAVQKIEELMKQELPNLVDERRFRRREPDAVERDEFGRVCIFREIEALISNLISVNGRKRRSRSISNHFLASTFVLKLLVMVALMSSISNKRPDAVFRSKAVAPDSWNTVLVVRVMRICISMLRKYRIFQP